MGGTKTSGPNNGVRSCGTGHHYRPDLPPVVQEIPCRSAKAKRTGSPVGLSSEANPIPRSDGPRSCLRTPPAATPTRGTTGDVVPHPSKARLSGPRGWRLFRARPGRPGCTRGLETKVKLSDPVPELIRFAPKFWPRVGSRTDQHLLKHISSLRVLGDA